MAALAKARDARRARAALRERIAAGELAVDEVLSITDPLVSRMHVRTLIEAVPGFGKAKARSLMARLHIPENRRVKGLGSRQRQALVDSLGASR